MGEPVATRELEKLDVFRDLSATGRNMLECGMQLHHFDELKTIINKGNSVSGAYVVVRGRLRVYSISPSGNEATLYFLNPGDICILALNCIFNNMDYPAWVQSEPDTSVGVIPSLTYRTLFQTEPSIQNLTVHALSVLVFRLMEELEEIHALNLNARLAKFILMRSEGGKELRMTQSELASHLGSTREVVAKLLRRMVADKVIRTLRGVIVVEHPEALAKQAMPQ
ncbi:MAG: Crp/Fnr family transcriptional regulator [Gammaproteobacteria bacterium]|nr:Crp/Fnr family transcriptional regulator [Gammaproteobacteria bacterium]MBU1776827.1 Crp/Fnr family transcriptional regulator [Gammaproteobacteria bacterium]MBU1969758.1 Crp/Fnr family transcriptional regulator [Gammaproteobacteria bacterium]